MKCIMFCKYIGGETTHHRCLVLVGWQQLVNEYHDKSSIDNKYVHLVLYGLALYSG